MSDYHKVPTEIAPFPEAMDGNTWSISGGRIANTSFKDHSMVVPLSDSDRDAFTRLHEMAHTRWTPRTKDPRVIAAENDIPWELLQAAEDMRLHEKLINDAKFTPEQMTGSLYDDEAAMLVKRLISQPDPLTPTTMAIAATARTKDTERLMTAFKHMHDSSTDEKFRKLVTHVTEKAREIVNNTNAILTSRRRKVKGATTQFDDTVAAAKFMKESLAAADKRPPPPEEKDSAVGADAEKGEIGDDDSMLREMRKKCFATPKGITDLNEWGTAELQVLPLTIAVKQAMIGRRNRAYDVGSVPRYMHRMYIDGRIFSMKRKAKGGTVLIDVSGSMNLDADTVDDMLEKAPCATIAMYAGSAETGRGFIFILARNGHRASVPTIRAAIEKGGGGNVVDGPALRWMSKQMEPRLWVCDGGVTGLRDIPAANLTQEAMAITRMYNIRRYDTMGGALKVFERAAKTGIFVHGK